MIITFLATGVAVAIVFTLMMLVHELGHFVVAKKAGVKVEEFGLGYPPRVFTVAKRGDTEFTINAIPVGAFVRLVGEEDPSEPNSLASKSRLVRFLVLSAGSMMNILLAVVLLVVVYMIGTLVPSESEPGAGIYEVVRDSPAALAGLRPGDTVIAVDGQDIQNYEALRAYTHSHLGQQISLSVSRDGATISHVEITPRVDPPEGEGPMGIAIGPALVMKSHPVWEAVPLAVYETFVLLFAMFQWAVAVVRGLVAPEVAGPIGILQATSEVVRYGLRDTIRFAAFLSTQLGVLNLLPFPALDGGRLVFVILEVLRRGKRISPEKEGLVHVIGMAILLGLVLVVSYFDVLRLASGRSLVP
jgi:regulator of sigma E protease